MAKRLAAGLVAALVTGCFATDEGVDPPLDRLYFPVGLAIDRNRNHLFVVNSNFDLQFTGGSLQSLDLARIRARLVPPPCQPDGTCDGGLICDSEPNDLNGGMPSGWCLAEGAPP